MVFKLSHELLPKNVRNFVGFMQPSQYWSNVPSTADFWGQITNILSQVLILFIFDKKCILSKSETIVVEHKRWKKMLEINPI